MSLGTVGLSTHIWNNNFRSSLLLAFYPIVLIVMAWALVFATGYFLILSPEVSIDLYGSSFNNPNWETGARLANTVILHCLPGILAVTIIWFTIAYFYNTKMVRMLSRSRPVIRSDEPELYNLLENLCIARGAPMPRLEIIETRARNAFASGINEKSFSITVTRGLLHCLQEDELEAVLGHELSHIINRDVRLLIISIIFTGMIGFIAQLFWGNFRYATYIRRGRKEDTGILLLMAIVAAILWLGYLATLFTRFALSRSREYMADAGSIEITKNPDAMMRALLRISTRDRIPEATDDIALMCIENTKPFMKLFMTHPPIEKRIKAISETTGTPIPEIKPGARALGKKRFKHPDDNDTQWLTAQRKGRKSPWK